MANRGGARVQRWRRDRLTKAGKVEVYERARLLMCRAWQPYKLYKGPVTQVDVDEACAEFGRIARRGVELSNITPREPFSVATRPRWRGSGESFLIYPRHRWIPGVARARSSAMGCSASCRCWRRRSS